ncbi:hypothetical protein BROUX41_002844 [Berkeleyomyces rouxiae]|uniref:uncharacterized protein n=1 Tax=Berkeleyomyces rouxiae TaxID=2035830 RepID=UPI003B826822
MSSPNLSGSFITTFNGRRCTAVPRSVSESSSTATPTPSSSTPSSTPTPEESTPSPTPSADPSSATSEAPETTQTPVSTPEPVAPSSTSDSIVPSIVPVTSSSTAPESTSADDVLIVAPDISTTTSTTTELESSSSETPDLATATSDISTESETSSSTSAISTTTPYEAISSTPAEQITSFDIADSITSATALPSSTTNIDDGSDGSDTPIGAIVGSVLGGLFFVILIALLLWWWRRRQLKKRRSTLLTPLTLDPNGDVAAAATKSKREKEYIIETGSVGPTPRSARFKAAVNYNVSKLRTQFSSADVTTDRNSRLPRAKPPMTRQQAMVAGAAATADKAKGWVFGMLGKSPSTSTGIDGNNVSARRMTQNDSQMGSKPDFMRYLGMNGNDLPRQANHSASNSASSTDHLLAKNRYSDPFSDDRALDAKALPDLSKAASRPGSDNGLDPFSDDNEVHKRNELSYTAALRQTRSKSIARSSKASKASSALKSESMYWLAYENQQSNENRHRFRSDQFDLDQKINRNLGPLPKPAPPPIPQFAMIPRPDSGISVNSNSTTMSVMPPKRPLVARIRGDSLSSKWSSGTSLGDWSDPGPDIGPSGLALATPLPSPLSKGAAA